MKLYGQRAQTYINIHIDANSIPQRQNPFSLYATQASKFIHRYMFLNQNWLLERRKNKLIDKEVALNK